MSRPTPRRSSLAGASPVTPPAPARQDLMPAATPPPAAASEAPVPQVRAAASGHRPIDRTGWTTEEKEAAEEEVRDEAYERTSRRRSKYPPKVSFYQDPEDTARLRAAILYTMAAEGHRNLSQFINRAVMAEVERLEAKYNHGQPFRPVIAGDLPQGRPMGE